MPHSNYLRKANPTIERLGHSSEPSLDEEGTGVRVSLCRSRPRLRFRVMARGNTKQLGLESTFRSRCRPKKAIDDSKIQSIGLIPFYATRRRLAELQLRAREHVDHDLAPCAGDRGQGAELFHAQRGGGHAFVPPGRDSGRRRSGDQQHVGVLRILREGAAAFQLRFGEEAPVVGNVGAAVLADVERPVVGVVQGLAALLRVARHLDALDAVGVFVAVLGVDRAQDPVCQFVDDRRDLFAPAVAGVRKALAELDAAGAAALELALGLRVDAAEELTADDFEHGDRQALDAAVEFAAALVDLRELGALGRGDRAEPLLRESVVVAVGRRLDQGHRLVEHLLQFTRLEQLRRVLRLARRMDDGFRRAALALDLVAGEDTLFLEQAQIAAGDGDAELQGGRRRVAEVGGLGLGDAAFQCHGAPGRRRERDRVVGLERYAGARCADEPLRTGLDQNGCHVATP